MAMEKVFWFFFSKKNILSAHVGSATAAKASAQRSRRPGATPP
jgi:hypothetical protein